MKAPSIDISGKIDPALVTLCSAVANCALQLQIPYLIVGATARDLVMHYGYGAAIQRATTDIDFALQLPSWDSFSALKNRLTDSGFTTTEEIQRLIAPNGLPIDIVPFGQIADETANIYWPPSGDFVMNVLGFEEALDSAVVVRLNNLPALDIPVASPVGMILLKLVAWSDREIEKRNKDAKDIGYLLTTYETIPAVYSYLYQEQSTMELYDWDLTLAAARYLGAEAKHIVSAPTFAAIKSLLTDQQKNLATPRLINEMSKTQQAYARNAQLLEAFTAGFVNNIEG